MFILKVAKISNLHLIELLEASYCNVIAQKENISFGYVRKSNY